MKRRAVLLLTACLLATACSDDPDVTVTGATPTAPASPVASAEPSPQQSAQPAAATAFEADAAPKEQASSGGPLTVTAVRVARQDGYDRVVFELDGRQAGEPGWQVEYTDDPRRDGSGDPVKVDGEATLVVLVSGAGYPFDTGAEEASDVSDPADLEVVSDVVLGAVYEGVYEAFIGVSREAPFRVTRLSDPARVVVDIRHE